MTQNKIAFVHYPHLANAARLETMSFALNAVVSLANAGWNIDLYLWEEPSKNYNELLANNITIKYFKEPQPSPLNRFRHIWFPFKFQQWNSYCCVFGLGQIGAYIAALIAKANNCPFIYFNEEFPSIWPKSRWSKLEQQVIKDAAMIVVPDLQRFYPLCQELAISPTKPHAALPNIPIVKPLIEEISWHSQLGLPQDSIPFLHAGTIADWAQVPELLSSVPYWPKKAVLVLHSRSQSGTEAYRQELSHLEVPGKVFWSFKPMPENQLNSLVSYCAGNFALYRNTGPNIEYVGFSSGKLMRSLVYGCPVIASKLTSLSFIAEYQLGILVNHPVEIPDAVNQIIQDRSAYKSKCLQFCSTYVCFEKAWEKLCEQLQQIVNIDLRQPMS